MRNLLFSICLSMYAANSFAEGLDTMLLSQVKTYRNDTVLETTIKYQYDARFNMIRYDEVSAVESFAINMSSYERSTYSIYEYDLQNRVLNIHHYNNSMLTGIEFYSYCGDRMTSQYSWSGGYGTVQTISTWIEYDEAGNKTRTRVVLVDSLEYGRIEEHFLITHKYDDRGRVIDESHYELFSTQFNSYQESAICGQTINYADSLFYRKAYEWNERNQIVMESNYVIGNILTETRWTTYDSLDRLVKVEQQFCEDTVPKVIQQLEYFEMNGTVCSMETVSYDSNYRQYCYNAAKKPIEEVAFVGPELQVWMRRGYSYNEEGYLLSETETMYSRDAAVSRALQTNYDYIKVPHP